MLLLQKIAPFFSYSLKANEKVLFFGSWPVGYPTLIALQQKFGNQNIQVITHSSSSISNTLEQFCLKQNIPLHMPINKTDTREERIKNWEKFRQKLCESASIYQLGVVCSYGSMIPSKIINLFKDSMILVHPSLIPKYRGGAPIFHAIANGDTISGVSYLEVVPFKFDTGNVLYQVEYAIDSKKYYRQIQQQLADVGGRHINYVIDNLSRIRPGKTQEEIMNQISIRPEEAEAKIVSSKYVSPNTPAQKVYNLNRALETPRFTFQGKPLILQFQPTYLQDSEQKFKVGQLVLHGKKLFMKCSDKLIFIKCWQEPTKKELPIYMFINQFIVDRKSYRNDLFVS